LPTPALAALAVYADGGICLDILQNNWSPIYDVSAVLTSIQSLLCDPNPNSPANSEAARMYTECRREYDKRVQVRRRECGLGVCVLQTARTTADESLIAFAPHCRRRLRPRGRADSRDRL
jgi:hypothetical protein